MIIWRCVNEYMMVKCDYMNKCANMTRHGVLNDYMAVRTLLTIWRSFLEYKPVQMWLYGTANVTI